MTEVWQLAEDVTLRPESFGGLAFHRRRGFTLELDGQAYDFLRTCLAPRPLPPPEHPAARLVPQLVRLGFLRPVDVAAKRTEDVSDVPWPGDGITLSAPETVHLAITARCNQACAGCYVPRREVGPELMAADWCHAIEQWARMRVFQVAVGGGEPLLYEGLFEVLACAHGHGIVPSLTTNGALLTSDTVRQLERAGVARVNTSWNGPGDGSAARPAPTRALQLLLDSAMQVGVNLLVTPILLPGLPHTLAQLHALGLRRVTLLRPKPPAIATSKSLAWYETHRLRRADLLRLRAVLTAWQRALHLEVDCALVGLMGHASPKLLRRRGVYGCTAGRRMCTVWPDGRVTPCSFLADLSAGDVRQAPFAELWTQGENWEALRDPTTRSVGGCAGCAAAPHCGGVRCIARHERGGFSVGDAECPHYRAQARTSEEVFE
ncbi:MAG: radical SAM/SPASM domain-containing protein [Chloroflexota bacterium]